MTIGDLRGIIRGRGRRDKWGYYIGGCELLEHVSDVPVFVSLLRKFERKGDISFLEDYPEPVGVILGGGVTVWYNSTWDFNIINLISLNSRYHYWHGGIFIIYDYL